MDTVLSGGRVLPSGVFRGYRKAARSGKRKGNRTNEGGWLSTAASAKNGPRNSLLEDW